MKPIKVLNKLNESVSLEQVKVFPEFIVNGLIEDEEIIRAKFGLLDK